VICGQRLREREGARKQNESKTENVETERKLSSTQHITAKEQGQMRMGEY